MTKKYPKTVNYIPAIGRRKQAVARIRLFKTSGETLVNDQPIEKYFPGAVFKSIYLEPFITAGVEGKYHATIKVLGSGKNGQLGAVVLGLARALVKLNTEKFRVVLKKKGLLTRDPRKRQRRMIGMGGKSRRKKQSPKR